MNNTKKFIEYTIQFVIFILVWILLILITQQKDPIQNLINKIETKEQQILDLDLKKEILVQEVESLELDLYKNYWLMRYTEPVEEDSERKPWDLTEDWSHQEMPELTWNTSHERFKEMAYAYWLDPSLIYKVEDHYRIKEWVILCITIAETSWGNRWYWKQNIWSVGSNDRWDRPTYALMESWLEAIWRTLNNWYLGWHTTLGCLSNAGSCKEANDNGKRYATSTSSREANMVACLSDIYEPLNPETFNIRR